mgnify:CR=1 FL=1
MSVETETQEPSQPDEPPTNTVVLTAGVCSFFIGALVAYATMNLGTYATAGSFVVAVALSARYLSRKQFITDIVGSASYIAGAVLVIAPSVLYLSNVAVHGNEVSMFPGVSGFGGIFGEDSEGGLAEVDSVGEMLFGQGGPGLDTVTQGSIEGIVPLVSWTVVFMMVSLVLFVAGMFLKNRGSRKGRWKEQRERD